MKRVFALFFLLCLLSSLAACAESAQDAPDVPPDAAGEKAPPADTDAAANSGAAPDEARRAAFAGVLRAAHDRRPLPDGTELYGDDTESIEGNLFSVHDVDGDGREELILLWQNTSMAGQAEIVYGYDETSGGLREKLRDIPGVIFYDNGAAEAPWSHNQGWGNEFWPYTLYRYRPESDTYENRGSVDAWDKALISNGFPRNADADGDGMVYVLLSDNWDFTCHRDPSTGEEYWYYEKPPVDGAEYLAWRDGIVGDAAALELSFLPLTAENIAGALGVPYVPLAETLLPGAAG